MCQLIRTLGYFINAKGNESPLAPARREHGGSQTFPERYSLIWNWLWGSLELPDRETAPAVG